MRTSTPHQITPGVPRLSVADLVSEVRRLAEAASWPTTPDGLAAALRQLDAAVAGLQALRLRMVATASHTRAETQDGFVNTGAWLAHQSRTTGADAARTVRLARGLRDLPGVEQALAAGTLSLDHAHVIAAAAADLPDTIEPAERHRVVAVLTDDATRSTPDQLRVRARRALATLNRPAVEVDAAENGAVQAEEDAAVTRTRFTWHHNGDGTVTGHFVIPTLAADVLRTAIERITAPRRQAARRRAAPQGLAAYADDWAHRCGLALTELLEHLPTDALGADAAATVVVTTDLATLQGRLRVASTDTGVTLSAGTVRRLACQAGIVPAVLGTRSLPLDLGRRSRLFSAAQRTALAAAYTTCAAAGCDRPYAWCEHHHEQPWSRGGPTDLDHAVPLCWAHHRMIHHPGYRAAVHTRPDGTKRVLFRQRP